jgi:GAF domain-containing protein
MNFKKYINSEVMRDVVIVCGHGKRYNGHEFVLRARSPRFDALLSSSAARSDGGVSILSVESLEGGRVCEALLELIYTGNYDETVEGLATLAIEYGLGEWRGEAESAFCARQVSVDMARYIDNVSMSDVSLVVCGQTFAAHKLMLCARCPYFEAMLLAQLAEYRDMDVSIELPNISVPVFLDVLRYIYGAEVSFSTSNALHLLSAASFYGLTALADKAEAYLIGSLSTRNVSFLWSFAQRVGATRLVEACLAYFLKSRRRQRINDVSFSGAAPQNTFYDDETTRAIDAGERAQANGAAAAAGESTTRAADKRLQEKEKEERNDNVIRRMISTDSFVAKAISEKQDCEDAKAAAHSNARRRTSWEQLMEDDDWYSWIGEGGGTTAEVAASLSLLPETSGADVGGGIIGDHFLVNGVRSASTFLRATLGDDPLDRLDSQQQAAAEVALSRSPIRSATASLHSSSSVSSSSSSGSSSPTSSSSSSSSTLSTAMSTYDDIMQKLAVLMNLVTQMIEADRSTLFLHDQATDELCALIAQGTSRNMVIRFPSSRGIAGAVFTSGKALNIPDAYADRRFSAEWDARNNYVTKQLLCVPVSLANGASTVVGCIQVINKRSQTPFSDADHQSLSVVAGLVSGVVQRLIDSQRRQNRDDGFEITSHGDFHLTLVLKSAFVSITCEHERSATLLDVVDDKINDDDRIIKIQFNKSIFYSDAECLKFEQEQQSVGAGSQSRGGACVEQFLNNPTCSDLQFRFAADERVYAHKIIMCTGARWFESMLANELSAYPSLRIDVDFSAADGGGGGGDGAAPPAAAALPRGPLMALLEFVYGGSGARQPASLGSLDADQCWMLARMARCFGVDGQLAACAEAQLASLIDKSNVCSMYAHARDLGASLALQQRALDFFELHIDAVSRTDDFARHGPSILIRRVRAVAPTQQQQPPPPPPQQQRRQLTAAAENIVRSDADPLRQLHALMDLLDVLFDADRSSLFVDDGDADELISPIATNSGAVMIHCSKTAGIAGQVFTSGRLLNVADAYAHAQFNRSVDLETGYRTQRILCVPVPNLSAPSAASAGVLQIINKRTGPFDANDETLASMFASLIAIVLDRAEPDFRLAPTQPPQFISPGGHLSVHPELSQRRRQFSSSPTPQQQQAPDLKEKQDVVVAQKVKSKSKGKGKLQRQRTKKVKDDDDDNNFSSTLTRKRSRNQSFPVFHFRVKAQRRQ